MLKPQIFDCRPHQDPQNPRSPAPPRVTSFCAYDTHAYCVESDLHISPFFFLLPPSFFLSLIKLHCANCSYHTQSSSSPLQQRHHQRQPFALCASSRSRSNIKNNNRPHQNSAQWSRRPLVHWSTPAKVHWELNIQAVGKYKRYDRYFPDFLICAKCINDNLQNHILWSNIFLSKNNTSQQTDIYTISLNFL